MLFQKKKIDLPNNNKQCRIRLDLINYMLNLKSEEFKKYEKECNKYSYSITNLNQSIQKINEVQNEKSNNSNDNNNNICLKGNLINNEKIETKEKIGIIFNNDNIKLEENKNDNVEKIKNNLNQYKTKYFLREKRPKIVKFLDENLIQKKRKRKIKKKISKSILMKKEKLNNKAKEIKIKKNNLKKIIDENEIKNEKNNTESLFGFFSYIDKKMEFKKEKKYCREKNKMSNEERKIFIQNLKEKIQKLTFGQIIQIQKKFFVNNIDNNEINLNLSELDQEHLKRLNIYVDSYMDDNLLDPNYISYTQELKNINQNQLENKKYKSIFDNISESDTFSDDDDSIQSEEFIKNQVHNQKDSNSETMED